MSPRKIISKTFALLCLTGFLCQTIEICYRYFHYFTSSYVSVGEIRQLDTPSLSLCIRYLDIIDRQRAVKYGLSPQFPKRNADVYKEESTLTVKQILDLTPKTTEVMSNCAFRDQRTHISQFNNEKSRCRFEMLITKYYTQMYVCYTFTHTKFRKFNFNRIISTTDFNMILGTVIMTDIIDQSRLLFLTLYISNDGDSNLPVMSKRYAPLIRRRSNVEPVTVLVNNFYSLTYQLIKGRMLPFPYDTKCKDYDYNMNDCYFNCLMRYYKEINRIPSSVMIVKPYNIKPISTTDLTNSSLSDIIIHAETVCDSECYIHTCDFSFAVTDYQAIRRPDFNLTFRIFAPNRPTITVTAIPRLQMQEFLIYIMSCCGIWGGVSVMSFDPSKWLEKFIIRTAEKYLRRRRLRNLKVGDHNGNLHQNQTTPGQP